MSNVFSLNDNLEIDKISKAVRSIAPQYGVSRVYLFGSYARGDATESSDYDFRIEGGYFRSLYDIIGISQDLEEALGKQVDVVMTDNIKPNFYDAIKEDEVLIYGEL